MKIIPVSVIIPTYNTEKYISEAIESVLAQTYKNYEIIVVDDGSTDNTDVIVKKYYKDIRYIRQKNQGLASARNTGICNANSGLICLLDADDQWLPEFLEKMISLYYGNPDAGVYFCSAQAIDAEGNKLPQIFGKKLDVTLNHILRGNFLIPSTIMMNYFSINRNIYFDNKFRRLQDWELWVRLLKQGYNFKGLGEVLVNYRIHKESLSTNPEDGRLAAKALVEKNFGVNDGKPEFWDAQKRRAYGGMYCYNVLSFIQRQDNWSTAVSHLYNAIISDPTISVDINFFYDIALGNQPMGFRSSSFELDLDRNAMKLENLISEVENLQIVNSVMRKVIGTANFALGLAIYNHGKRSSCRKYFAKALYYRPDLLSDNRFAPNFIKSFISREILSKIKQLNSRVK